MVNYCCVYGCARNSKTSKHLYFYSLPKEKRRLLLWLEAIGREDLLEKDLKKLNNRVCSRHFSPSSIKNKHLCADAVPTLCLPNNLSDGSDKSLTQESVHSGIICNSCNKPILGFRYKCITCPDYDLCSKCEMLEAHAEHYLLRIPKPVKFTVADDLINKWQEFLKADSLKLNFKTSPVDDVSSDDDVPITKYASKTGIELTEEVKSKIRDEVTRILNIKHPDKCDENATRRKIRVQKKKEKFVKRTKAEETADKSVGTEELESIAPEVFFADVNDTGHQIMELKDEMPLTALEEPVPPIINIKLNDELSEFLIGVKYP